MPVGARVRSPTRLVRARSGIVPYSARQGLLDELKDWLGVSAPFAGCVIGGRGGCGKTRLGVELCKYAEGSDWLCGLVSRIVDPAALEDLAVAPTARLVVVDYAESRAEQLETLLPLLMAKATTETPVRVLLLVRAGPRRTEDWTEALQGRGDWLDAVLDECDKHVLEDMPLATSEREALFNAATSAFAGRVEPQVMAPGPPEVLGEEAFGSPLLVVVAAYLAVHGDTPMPSTKTELLEELLGHEQRYWRENAAELFSDDVVPRRVVGLATLAGARDEDDAAALLRLLPDMMDADAERCRRLARWVNEQYPGPSWWNPLEPDLLGEHLVAETFTDKPEILAGVLAGEDPGAIVQPLDVFARAVNDHHLLEAALKPIISRELVRLCEVAVAQATTTTDRDLIYSSTATAAAAINRAITAIKVDLTALRVAVDSMPPRPDLILSPLALTLTSQLVEHLRPLAAADSSAFEPDLASSLNSLSLRLEEAGRPGEAVTASEEAIEIRRRLAAIDSTTFEPDLALSLNNLSNHLGNVGRPGEAATASEEAVAILRRLAGLDPTAYEPYLGGLLSNLSLHLTGVGRHKDGLVSSEEAVEIYRRLATADSAAYRPELARSLTNLSLLLVEVGRARDGLIANEEAVEIYRRLTEASPAAYEPYLARSLINLSLRLGGVGRPEDGLVASEEAVEIYRRLTEVNLAAHEPYLAGSLNSLSLRLGEVGRPEDGLVASEEAVEIYRRLAEASPAAYEPYLARSLTNLSLRLEETGRRDEGLTAIETAADIHRHLTAASPAVYEPELASTLSSLSVRLAEAGRREDAESARQELAALSISSRDQRA